MRDSHEVTKMVHKMSKTLFSATFFRTLEKVVAFEGEPIYFVEDRYTIKDLGIRNGYKWVELSNSNACAPFHSIVLGLKQSLPVKTWWKETSWEEDLGTEEKPFIFTDTYYPDSAKPVIMALNYKSGDHAERGAMECTKTQGWQSLLSYGLTKGWWMDNPNWIDRFALYGFLSNLLLVFKDWKKMDRD